MRYYPPVLLYTISLVLIGLLNACYTDLKPPPECYEANVDILPNEDRLNNIFNAGVSGYCSTERISCLEIWTGYTEEELSEYRTYYATYPYISLIEEQMIAGAPSFSLCVLPTTCEAPECGCVTNQDCDQGTVCVGAGFFSNTSTTPSKRTTCLPVCDEQSSCTRQQEKSYCAEERCLLPPL